MQRFFTLVCLLLFALPLGLSVTGCTTNVSAYCNSAGYGPKTGDIYSVRLPISISETGISLGYGQIGQVNAPTASGCKGATLSTGGATYGSSNLNLVDINPSTGAICGGTWNRLSPGGIPDFTICTPPSAAGTATVTASVGGIVSNPVTVYVHPQISAITISDPTACVSQNGSGPNLVTNTAVFGADGNLLPSEGGSNVVGTVTYAASTPSVVTINNTSINATAGNTNNQPNGATVANQSGGTVITATISGGSQQAAGTSSAAGYFYTCPPQSIALNLPSSTGTKPVNGVIPITAGNPQTITASITDTSGNPLTPATGSGPDYTSTQPQQVQVANAVVSSTLPGTATVTGICQPGLATSSSSTSSTASSTSTGENCNPTPLNKLGVFGTGLPVTANPLLVSSPGVNGTKLWAASPESQQFTPFDLTLGTSGAPVLLPFPPNSMVLDPTGQDLYFGSYRELMVYSASNNALTTQDISVPGVVLAVSPSNNQVVIADQLRKVIYLYTPATRTAASTPGGTDSTTNASVISIGGVATHAIYAPDGKNVYIVGPDTLYVHNVVSGWSTYPLTSANATTTCALDNTNSNPFCSPDVAITVPSVAVFLSGNPVTARSFCPDTTTNPVTYNPLAATVTSDAADHLAATPDGLHMIGASTTGLFDIEHTPGADGSSLIAPIGPCPGIVPGTAGALQISTTLQQLALTGITPTQIDQVLASPDSTRAFITYNAANAGGLLPMYTPAATGTGALTNIQLATGAQAPIAGAITPDSSTFFVSTTGDNLIHQIDTASQKDVQQLNPQLTNQNGQPIPAQFLVLKARPTT